MRQRQEGAKKRPSGGRPVPRRLFSFDSIRKEKPNAEGDSSTSDVSALTFQTSLPEKPTLELSDSQVVEDERWTAEPLVTSPEPQGEASEYVSPTQPQTKRDRATTRPLPLDLEKSLTVGDNASITSASLASPSKRRWDTIRHHVLPSISSSADIPPEISTTPPRPSTPKSYKFGQKKAFRQVVETAQTQQQGESRRFAEAIRIACWEVRFGETAQQLKPDREPTLGSSLHLPFALSTSSLPTSSAASILTAGTRAHGLRRPPSMSSMVPSSSSTPSITRLARALTSTMSFNRPRELPHEKLVLSTLLVPFLSPPAGSPVVNEQATAVETFEYIIRTWNASSPTDELERCVWCCRSASLPSPSRMRILGTLSSILFARDKTFIADSPSVLQSLLQALLSLGFSLSLSPRSAAEYQSVMGYIAAIRAGSCGPLLQTAVEREYGVRYASGDNDHSIHTILVTESAIRCLGAGPDRQRRWVLRTLLREYWPLEDNTHTTTLYACAQWRKLKLFLPAARHLVSQTTVDSNEDCDIICSIIRTRVLVELKMVCEEDVGQIKREIVYLLLELLGKQTGEQQDFILAQFCEWLRSDSGWKADVETAFHDLMTDELWTTVLRLIPNFVTKLSEELQVTTLSLILPVLYKRMILDTPELPCAALSHFLEVVSRAYPKIFYKPLFSCAAATKDATITHQLKIINAINRILPDFWFRDPDMISIALLSSVNTPRSNSSSDINMPHSLRIGQLALTLELEERIRLTRSVKDMATVAAATKFATSLEARLGIIIEARERTAAIPQAQRLVLCSLLRQIRLLIRSIRPAAWLPNVIHWVLSWPIKGPHIEGLPNIEAVKSEAIGAFRQLEEIYHSTYTKDSPLSSKRKSATLSSAFGDQQGSEVAAARIGSDEGIKSRLDFLKKASRSYEAFFLELLVAVSGMLSADDHVQLGPALWGMRLAEANAEVLGPACFLLMQFAERNPDGFTIMVENELRSVDASGRRRVLEQMSVLSTWRFQLLAQEVILDRNHRRPFKLQRPPVLFVATDIGSSTFVYDDDTEEYRDIHGHIIPSELRRRLSEIGWAQEDRVVDHRLQRIRTPMTLLPSQQLDKLDYENTDNGTSMEPPSPSASPEPSPTKSPESNTSLTRQESIVGSRAGTKRRPIFVPALLSLFPAIATLTNDIDYGVADMARGILIDFMRDDPTLLSRDVFQTITGGDGGLDRAITTLRQFLHAKHILPPGMAHHILNHLTGLLKAIARNSESPEPLRSFAYAMSSIAKLFPQVNKSSLRELRRNKVDTFMIPSGSLWFSSVAPAGPMFPRTLPADTNPFESIPPPLVYMMMVRTSQNLLFVSMLRRNPQDLKVVRKGISDFQLPSLSRTGVGADLSLKDMAPEPSPSRTGHRTTADTSISALSITLARSYLLLIQQILLCMSRHLNDRTELAALMDGLNRILLAHKDDIGIIAHVMLAYMTAATRFKRLFVSGGGYMLFMPAVIKVYIEAEEQPHIRRAIAYSTQRFYTLHQESFVFQSFDSLGPIVSYSSSISPWVASGLASLFMCLRPGIATPTSDAAGILDMNKEQEQEALMVTMAEEVPQTFLASLRRGRSSQDKTTLALPVLEGYETKRFKMDDLVRLLLTVIAHNPGIQRAEHFLTFLRAFTPHLFGVSRAVQTVLRTGVDALGAILLTRTTGRQKGADSHPTENIELPDYEAMADGAPRTQNSSPSSLLNMRLEYLQLVVAFTAAGGQVTPATMARAVELVKSILKDSRPSTARVGQFMSDFLRALLMREAHPDVKDVVASIASIAPLCSTHIDTLDLSDTFNILHKMAVNALYASNPAFTRLVAQYCGIGIRACERLATEELLFASPLRMPLVTLLQDALTMDGADVMAELERSPLSHEFLAGVLLPVTLTFRTSAVIVAESQWTEGARRNVFSSIWIRLLNLALSICEKDFTRQQDKSPALPPIDRRKSSEQTQDGVTPLVKSLSVALQIVKVIITRAEEDISSASRGIWAQLGNRLKSLLADGDAMFALRVRDYSEPPSPALSPRTSTFGESQQNLFAFPSSASIHGRPTYNPPRLIDYLAWSIIEWCWLRRSPLMLQMRIFAQERIVNLATELRLQGTAPLHTPMRTGGRRFSSVFSKPRRSVHNPSAPSSVASTPRNSVHLSGSVSLPQMNGSLSLSSTLAPSQSLDSRQAGYARMPSPISPSGRTSQDSTGLKIVHLGPVESSLGANLARTTSTVTDDVESRTVSAKHLAKETFIASHFLTRMTYRRIRLVQHLMGYSSMLLPMPGSDYVTDDMNVETAAWSRNDALQAIVEETRELLDEFRESFGELGGESLVMVDSVPSLPSLHN